MIHNNYCRDLKFHRKPLEFNKNSDKELLQYCLGATLYMPGTKVIVEKILERKMEVTSMVMCFEDAIKEEDVSLAENNVLEHLQTLYDAIIEGELSINDVPLIFLRVRDVQQFFNFSKKLTTNQAGVLTGFVFPKFYSENAQMYLQELKDLNSKHQKILYGMPILEGKTIAFKESRMEELLTLKKLIDPYDDLLLNIRVGGTDFSSFFGVRRGINTSIYEIITVRDCLADILNIFGRHSAGYTVSGPVWEYFLAYKKDDLSHLLEKNFHRTLNQRNTIVNDAIDGLLREVVLDKANGFVGKTIIHPSHARFVNGMQAVTREEYEDAMQVLNTSGGVIKSKRANKMNEINPHRNWAEKIVNRSKAYGVIEDEKDYLKLIIG